MSWFKALSLGGKALASLMALLLAVGIIWGAYRYITAGERAKAKLGANQTEAAVESGRDAVQTVGAAGEREAGIDTTTRENANVIHNAEGADAPVAGGVRDAGLDSLCKRAAYKSDPKCVQRAAPR